MDLRSNASSRWLKRQSAGALILTVRGDCKRQSEVTQSTVSRWLSIWPLVINTDQSMVYRTEFLNSLQPPGCLHMSWLPTLDLQLCSPEDLDPQTTLTMVSFQPRVLGKLYDTCPLRLEKHALDVQRIKPCSSSSHSNRRISAIWLFIVQVMGTWLALIQYPLLLQESRRHWVFKVGQLRYSQNKPKARV